MKRIASAFALLLVLTACSSSSRSSSPSISDPGSSTTSPQTAVAGTDGTADDAADFPSFRPAPGWQAVSTPETFSATAANIAVGPGTSSGDMPWDTVARLEAGDVVLLAMFIAPRESWGDDVFPARSLPLSLDDALNGIGFEGQPDHIYADRLGARVNGWAIDLLVFYGGGDRSAEPPVRRAPSAETRAAAQEQLARLVVPARRIDG